MSELVEKVVNKALEGMALEYETRIQAKTPWEPKEPMRDALLWLADNVSDEMVAEFRASLDRFPPNEWLPQIGYAKAISAALRAAGDGR